MKKRKPRKKTVGPPLNERLSYSAREFALVSGISYWLLYEMWKKGIGPPSRKVGTRRIIEAEAGKRWLAGQES